VTLLRRSSLRYLLHHPWQLALSALGVAVAVAVVVGIDLANAGASRAFRASVEAVAGEATHEIVGGPGGLDEEVYVRLRVDEGFRRSSPLLRSWVASPAAPGRTFELLGIDPFAEPPFRSFTGRLAEDGDLGAFLTRPGAAALGNELARELDLELGDALPITFSGRSFELEVVALLEAGDELAAKALETLLVVDLASAQEVLNRPGELSGVDLRLPEEGRAELLARLETFLPPGAELRPKEARAGALEEMTRAFQLNLSALSLLALLVGMFLIYNTLTFSVVQRRGLIGRLRALGVVRREVFSLVLGEAAVIGVLGTTAGLLLGIALAQGLLELVVRTINDLYFVLSVREAALEPLSLAKGLVLGLGATLVAAIVPAREATAAPPRAVLQRSALESRSHSALPRTTAVGLAFLALGGGLLLLPSRDVVSSFASIFAVVLGSALLVPGATVAAARLLAPAMRRVFGLLGSMAARGLEATLSRTGVAMAALVIAISMSIGVAIMVESFRATLVDWLGVTLQADVYAAPVDVSAREEPTALDPEIVAELSNAIGVERAMTYRRVWVGSPGGRLQLAAVDMEEPSFAVYRLAAGEREAAWRGFREDGAILVSEPLAYRRDLEVGDTLELTTDRGARSFAIAGIYYDYASESGIAVLHRSTYDRFYDDREIHSVGLYLEDGVDAEAFIFEREGALAGRQQIGMSSNREIRRLSLEIFDRTFLITGVLRLLAVIVAFIGILSALMALQLERARELGVLRASGLTPGQVWGLVTAQTGLMGLVAGILAMPVGVVMAWLLVHVINRRSFGWTLVMEISPLVLAQAVVLALVAALLAGLYPAWKMSKASPALALREE